ncbi:MAG: dihydrolipoamide acetyltransferase family protein [Gemmatimonadaceae bacterium]
MARIDVIMPQMGESIAEGTVSRWLKKVGDAVKRDEALFEISTDKVDAEIPSPSAGILAEILVGEGTTVGINTVVARLETDASVSLGTPPAAPAPVVAAPSGTAASAKVVAPTAIAATAKPVEPSAPAGSFEDRVRTKSSPLVRKIAAEHGVEIGAMSGSGIAGRVTRKDIEAFLADRPAAAGAAVGVSMHAPAGAEQHGPMPTAWAGDTVEPMSKMRRLTSDHMTNARRSAAHVTTFFEIDLTRMTRVRAHMRKDFEAQTGQKLTSLPFILQAVAKQLKRHPVLNAAVAGTDVIYRNAVNIGIAVALDPVGLIVPVIKHADDLSLAGLSRSVNDLATRARGKKLSPTEVQDATFTVTNPGVFGSVMGTPIIPLGTTAILGLGAIEKRPKVMTGPDGEDTIAIRTCAYFSLSFDHRVVDGADADKFMVDLKKTLELIPDTGF